MTNADMLAREGLAITADEISFGPEAVGYHARPADGEDRPGIVVIHEWWGLNQYIKDTADQLAREGYRTLAVNLFGKAPATTPEEAREQIASLDRPKALAELRAAAQWLRAQGAPRVCSLGWCFGGGQSLQLAVSGEPLEGTIIYYGTPLLTDRAALEAIRSPVLGIFGAEDQAIPVETVDEFKKQLDALGVENDIVIYPGVGHAFANPSGQRYAPEPTKDAWARTLAFLKKNLGT